MKTAYRDYYSGENGEETCWPKGAVFSAVSFSYFGLSFP
jgi:hypothetical protein